MVPWKWLRYIEPKMGCIEDISNIHKAKPELSAVLDCRSMLWSKYTNICKAIVDSRRANGAAGVLCCCRHKCPIAIGDSPTSNEIGFQSFNVIS
uniref:Uncharacterized protein n=1 Tax=Parascaris equorum TaxID=6256 RepID=A0A914RSP8_PAREQ